MLELKNEVRDGIQLLKSFTISDLMEAVGSKAVSTAKQVVIIHGDYFLFLKNRYVAINDEPMHVNDLCIGSDFNYGSTLIYRF
jgi:hypothetical protein